MTHSLSARSPSPRRWPLAAAALALLAAGGGGWWLTSHRSPGTGVGVLPDDQTNVDRFVRRLEASFDRSRQYQMLRVGERLSRLNAPTVPSHPQPNWNAPMLITFGSEFAPQVKALHTLLLQEHVPLQLVHVMYNPAPPTADGEGVTQLEQKKVAEFSPQVALLDAVSHPTPELNAALKAAGMREAGYAFLRDAGGHVVYADDAIGLSTQGVYSAVKAFAQGGADAVKVRGERPLPIGKALPLQGLPASVTGLLKTELNKPRAVLFFSSDDCSVCTPWKASASPYVQTLKKQGYGVVFVRDADSAYGAKVQPDGSLEVSGPTDQQLGRTALARLWNLRLFPGAYLFRDGKLQGEVSFLALKTDQREYYDVQFMAVQKLLERKN